MAYVGFNRNGYEYLDKENVILFSSDNTHNHLFEYIDMDLSQLPVLLRHYISKKMDVTNLELKEYSDNDEEITAIKEILLLAHPYYQIEYKKVIINAIGKYFNTLLVYLFYKKGSVFYNELNEELYIKKIIHLMPSTLVKESCYPNGSYPLDFYNNYRSWIGDHIFAGTEIEESIISVPQKEPSGFDDEINTQRTLSNLLYFILDISVDNMRSLTLSQRIWIYNNIFNTASDQPLISATHCFLFQSPVRYLAGHDYSEQIDLKAKAYDKLSPLFAFRAMNLCRDEVPKEMEDSFISAINFAKGITTDGIYEEYEIDNICQLLYLEVLSMINANIMIKKCRNCGKYFIVNDRKKAYCDRIYNSKGTCSTVGPNLSFQKKMKNEPALDLYNHAYKAHHARVKNKKMSIGDFSLWAEEAKKNLEKVRSGELDITVFKKWLKQ